MNCNGLLRSWGGAIAHLAGLDRGRPQDWSFGSAPLFVGGTDTNPWKNSAFLNCILEVSGVPGNEPRPSACSDYGRRLGLRQWRSSGPAAPAILGLGHREAFTFGRQYDVPRQAFAA